MTKEDPKGSAPFSKGDARPSARPAPMSGHAGAVAPPFEASEAPRLSTSPFHAPLSSNPPAFGRMPTPEAFPRPSTPPAFGPVPLPLPPTKPRRAWPLLPLPPLIVVVVGLLVAGATGAVGVRHLAQASEEHAAFQADLLAGAVAARLAELPVRNRGGVPLPDRLEALQLAARRTGAEFLLLSYDGDVLLDASLGPPERTRLRKLLAQGSGETTTGLGRTRFHVRPLGPPPTSAQVVAFVREPTSPEGAPAFVTALVALTTLLLGVAATVAYSVARDAYEDVVFLTQRVRGMVLARTEPAGEPVPVRTIDEIGTLTGQFNALVGRFGAAERTYRDNLARANAADRDRAAFLAAVSHELRSPLNAILGFADILATEVDGPLTPTAREEVQQIRGSGAHLLSLINDILEFSALESGQLKLSLGSVDLASVAADVVRESQGLLGDKPGLLLRLEGEASVLAYADRRRVRQVLTNIVGNAVKFTRRGQVVVSASSQGGTAVVTVSDTGPGISEAERAVIFEEYKQAGDERRRRRGTGLGLAIARRLVLMQGGSIRVESELGRGSVFHVRLPAWSASRGGASREGRGPNSRQSSRLRIAARS